MITKEAGRRLMVEFTCSRCRRKAFESYDDVMKGETYGHLTHSELPKDWHTHGTFKIFCQQCHEAYVEFMEEKR